MPLLEALIGLAIGEPNVLNIDVISDGLVHRRNEFACFENFGLALDDEFELVEQLLCWVEGVRVGRKGNQLDIARTKYLRQL